MGGVDSLAIAILGFAIGYGIGAVLWVFVVEPLLNRYCR